MSMSKVGAVYERQDLDLGQVTNVLVFLACIACASAGCLRFVRRHLVYRADYGLWLARTPWHLPNPLPLGPLFFELRDLLWIAPMLLVAATVSLDVLLWTIVATLAGYVSVGIFPVFVFAPPAFGYFAVFMASFVLLAPLNPVWVAAVLFMVLAPVALGNRIGLQSFPWPVNASALAKARRSMYRGYSAVAPFTVTPEDERPLGRDQIGWPCSALLGRPESLPGAVHACVGGALIAWIVYLKFRLLEGHATEETMYLATAATLLFTLVFAVVRLLAFLNEYRAPISFWGRIWTRRFVIWRFDIVFVASVFASMLGFAAFLAGDHYGIRAVLTGLAAATLLGAPPSMRVWVTSCAHRAALPWIVNENTLFKIR
jgi:hypothetical protein